MLTYHEKSKDHFLQCHAILLKGAKPIVRALAEDTRVSSLYSSAPLGHVRIYMYTVLRWVLYKSMKCILQY